MGWPQYLWIGMSLGALLYAAAQSPEILTGAALSQGFGDWVLYMGDFYA